MPLILSTPNSKPCKMPLKTLHILHISTARSWRGGEQQVAYLIKKLAENQVNQAVVCIKDGPFHQWCLQNSVPVLGLKKGSSFDLNFARKIKAFARENKSQILHAHDAHAHGFAVYANAFFNAEIPIVVSRRVDFPVAKNWLSAFKYNHRSVRKIICVSEAIAKIVKSKIKAPHLVSVVHSAIDTGKFDSQKKGALRKELSLSEDAKIIGNVAALVDHKDHLSFIACAEILAQENPNYCFIIAGDGELREMLEKVVQSKNLSKRFFFLGFRQDVASLLKDFDIFLFTSKTEGLGTSILDAFAAKVPTIATAAGGIPEIVIHEKTGLLCEIGDSEGLAQAVKRLLSDDLLRAKLVDSAGAMLSNFSLDSLASKTLSEYQQVLAEDFI